MKNLMTRKIVLGMFMMLVLMLGMQGRADAITLLKISSGDQAVVSINQPFTISFSVGIQNVAVVDDEGNPVYIADDDNYYSYDSAGDKSDYFNLGSSLNNLDDKGDDAGDVAQKPAGLKRAYYYDEEAISIASNPAGITFRRSGTVVTSLSETETDSNKRLSGSITLSCVASDSGMYGVTITDTTNGTNKPGTGPSTADLIAFKIYVWANVADSQGSRISDLGNGTAPEYGTVDLMVTLTPETDSTADFARVEFEVFRGPGTLYEDKNGDGKPDKGPSKRLTTFTNNGGTTNRADVSLIPNRGTSHVRAWVSGNAPDAENRSTEAIYVYGYSQLRKVSGDSPEQVGPNLSRLEDPFVVQLYDSTGRTTIPGAVITFASTGGLLAKNPSFSDDLYANSFPNPATMETDSNGRASVFLVLDDTTDTPRVTATHDTYSVSFEASRSTGTEQRTPHFIGKVAATDGQRADEFGVLEDALTVIVRDQLGDLLPDATVEFEARDGGTLSPPELTKGDPGTVPSANGVDTDSRRRDIVTNTSGEASVRYTAPDSSGRKTVTATLEDGTRRFVTFTVNGAPSTRDTTPPPTTPPPTTTNPTLTLSQSSIEGAGGSRQTLTATLLRQTGVPAVGIGVTFALSTSASGGVDPAIDITDSSGQAQTTIILPSSSARVTVSANVDGTPLTQTASITITGAATGTGTGTQTPTPTVGEPSRLSTSDSSLTGEVNRRLDGGLTVRVVDSNGSGVVGEVVSFRVTEGRGRLSPARPRTDSSGYAEAGFTPLSTGTIEIQAVLGNLSPVTFTINTGEPPDAIKKISGDNQSGRPGARLANPFVVEVVDENDDPVSGITVTFAVTAGGGSVSPASTTTNNNGRAQTTLTLGDEIGDNTVTASVTGLRAVTFTAGAGAEVRVDASNRAPIYWIDKQSGTLHRLVDDEVENLASNVEGVTSLAVDEANGLIYWGVQVGQNGGKIQRSRLNGRNVQTLKDKLTSVPMGIALDAAGGTIYWTSASGKIRSMATEGSTQVTKIVENLANPTVLAVSNGHLYWAEPLGRVGRVSLTATRKVPENIATALGEPLSIAIAKGKIYWIERNGGGRGALQRANLNGENIEELRAFTGGVPTGIAIDSSENKIYWTKLSKIQRTSLVPRYITDIVTGLMRPGAIALGGTVPDDEPVVTETKQPKKTTTTTKTATPTDNSKYDVNGDGTVNNIDITLVAVSLGTSNAKYDVNGDGTVDVTDLRAVIANTDDDAAAPAIDIDLAAFDIDFDRVQEQIEILLASDDLSFAAQRALMYLQHLLASARPDETVLLVNYPNPFNPETWIPYHLAISTDVRINIYNAQGILVRALTLGHQSAGYYTSRSRAAYWDGRNALGERVASGIYFYQLQADEISPLRKMVILK